MRQLLYFKFFILILTASCCIYQDAFSQKSHADSVFEAYKKQPHNIILKLEAGIANVKKGNADRAILLLNEVAATALKTNNLPVYIKAKINIGRFYADKGENVIALKHYQQGLVKAEAINNKLLTAHLFKNIGALYISWKKFDDALNYYERAEKLAHEVHEEELVADCQNNKGTVYEQQFKYEKALVAYKNALTAYTKKNITVKVSMALSNIAIVYKNQKNYAASLQYNLKALNLSIKNEDKWITAATYNNMGSLYGEMGDYKNAMIYCSKSVDLAKQINAIEIVESAYDTMSEVAAKAGDYKNAYNYHKLFKTTNDKFINIESARQLSELNIKFETERKQKIIQQQQFEINQRTYWLFGSVILSVFIVIVGYLVFINHKYKQDEKLQAEIHKQQEIAARALFEGEQQERIRLARDLHDSIGQMLSVVKMNISMLSSNQDAEIAISPTLNLVDKTINEIRNISHNLIPEELNFGLITALEDICEKISNHGLIDAYITVDEKVKDYKFKKANELSIYRVIQEVLNNMVKHAKATQIKVNISHQQQNIIITIKDNGCGFDIEKLKESKGIGWKNILARVNLMGGKVSIKSAHITGTFIKFNIPDI